MSHPSGMRAITLPLETGDKVLVYSDANQIFLQLRHQTPTEQDVLTPSFKVAVSLSSSEALSLANELINIVSTRLKRTKGNETEEIPGREEQPSSEMDEL